MSAARPIQLDDLTYFLAVVETGTMAGGARRVGADPSTVSRRIGRLEDDLGVTLFTRTGARMLLSEAGVRLAERVQQAMNLVDVGIDEVTQAEEVLEGEIRFAAPTEVGTTLLMPELTPFLERHPGIVLNLLLGTRLVELERREADLAIRTSRPTRGHVVTRRLGSSPLVPYRARHLPNEEARLRWLAFSPVDPLIERLLVADPRSRLVLRSNDMSGLRAACQRGLGTAWLPQTFGEAYGLVPLEGVDPVPGIPIWIASPKTSLELPRVRALWDFVVEAFEAMPSGVEEP